MCHQLLNSPALHDQQYAAWRKQEGPQSRGSLSLTLVWNLILCKFYKALLTHLLIRHHSMSPSLLGSRKPVTPQPILPSIYHHYSTLQPQKCFLYTHTHTHTHTHTERERETEIETETETERERECSYLG